MKLPDRNEAQRRFAALPRAERREIMRAVNRGRAVEEPKHAGLAVMAAQRQRRFWRYAWLLGPVVGAAQFLLIPWQAALANAVLGTATLGLLAWFWYRRATRAGALNLELAQGARRRTTSGGGRRAHLPGEASRRPRTSQRERDDGEAASGATSSTVPGRRPYRPRGRKRRER